MIFLSKDHEETYRRYIGKAQVHPEDKERKSLFYILSGNSDLRTKDIKKIYDFKENMLCVGGPEGLEKLEEKFCLCSSSKALLYLALNLYSSSYESLSFTDTFRHLGPENYRLVMQALKIRFE
ncbi:MAG: hypothetical protein KKA19_09005 [Candidatus Margulisbacteria bacterium]|nr:hypothetical protein [Candidatus Margulisiibacteriota bacterium]